MSEEYKDGDALGSGEAPDPVSGDRSADPPAYEADKNKARRLSRLVGRSALSGIRGFSDAVVWNATRGKYGSRWVVGSEDSPKSELGDAEPVEEAPYERFDWPAEPGEEEAGPGVIDGEPEIDTESPSPPEKDEAETTAPEEDAETPPEPPEEPLDEAKLFAPLAAYIERVVHDEAVRDEIKKILTLDADKLLDNFINELGIEASNKDAVIKLVKSSNVRLIMDGLRDLGMPKSKADEAHKIIKTEKGDIRVEHIVGLGFSADDAEAVHELLSSSKAHHISEGLKKLGLGEDEIDQLLMVTGEDKLVEASLLSTGIEEHVAARILILRENAKVEEIRKEELGYGDAEKIKTAVESLGIKKSALEAAEKQRIPIDLLIEAATNPHEGLRNWLESQGITLTEGGDRGDGPEPSPTKDTRRETDPDKAPSTDPYPPGHPLHGLGYAHSPHIITKGEVEGYREDITKHPGRLRNTLIKPGSLPLPKQLYHNLLTRPVLDVLNAVWIPMPLVGGRRRLAKKVYKFYRSRNPNEDYGALGRGTQQRRTELRHIREVEKTIHKDRSLLSWHRRHRNKGNIRSNARLDLAQDIAEVKRDLLAFEMGRPVLPSEDEYTYWKLKERRPLSEKQQELYDTIKKKHPEFETIKEKPLEFDR